jgi:hypothetical protein
MIILDGASASPEPMQTMTKRIFLYLSAAIVISSTTSCLPLAAGAAAGYIAHDQGLRVQNPITRAE